MVYNLWVYVYWFVYKTHFRHTVALAPENVAVKGLKVDHFEGFLNRCKIDRMVNNNSSSCNSKKTIYSN